MYNKYNFRIFLAFSLHSMLNKSIERSLIAFQWNGICVYTLWMNVATVKRTMYNTSHHWLNLYDFLGFLLDLNMQCFRPAYQLSPVNESVKYYVFISKCHTPSDLIEFFSHFKWIEGKNWRGKTHFKSPLFAKKRTFLWIFKMHAKTFRPKLSFINQIDIFPPGNILACGNCT